MNKYSLKFLDNSLEDKYQDQKLQKLKQPVMFGALLCVIILNVLKIILNFVQHYSFDQYLNFSYVGLASISLIIVIKNKHYIRHVITINNIAFAFLQINFSGYTTEQEYYSYGSSFTTFQIIGYFVSDFYDALLQVSCHLIIKIVLTTIYSERIDSLATCLSIFSSLCILVTIYISDSNTRKQFLSILCDDVWEKQLPNLIKRPFIKLNYQDNIINIISCNQINQFIGYQQDLCDGCNARVFLSNCYIEGRTLYSSLIQKIISKEDRIIAKIKNCKFALRICNFGVEYTNRIIILEEQLTKPKQHLLPSIFSKELNKLIIRSRFGEFLKFYNWGILSYMLINDTTVGVIKVPEIITQLNKQHKKYLNPVIILNKSEKSISFKTYSNLVKIFLIQIYHILIQIHGKNFQTKIRIKDSEYFIEIQLMLIDSFQFMLLYNDNFLIQQLQGMLLWNSVLNDTKIQFSKQLPYL